MDTVRIFLILLSTANFAGAQNTAGGGNSANPEPGSGPKPACLNGADQVITPHGQKRIDQLAIGDLVAIGGSSNSISFEPILTFLHRNTKNALGFRFSTSTGRNLTLSDEHLIFLAPSGKAVLAKNVKIGDEFYVLINGDEQMETVVEMERSVLEGRYSPLTKSGTILVNNVLVSCYSQIQDHQLMHSIVHLLLPFIKCETIFGSDGIVGSSDGLHALGNTIWHFFRHWFVALS